MINNEEDKVSHSYDYIIIGAGPSACGLLHGLLSHEQHININKHQTRRRTICLIESGSSKQQTSTTYAKDWPKTALYANSNNNNYISTPQTSLNNRILDIPIGSGLGGTSNINACLLSSPNYTTDFIKWPKKYQDGKIVKGACDHLVSVMRSSGSMTDRKVCQKFMNVLGDENGSNSSCCDMQQQESLRLATANDGMRINYFESLVQPLLSTISEDILTIRTNTIAERILWDNNNNNKEKQITGVICKDQLSGQNYIISANKEVILCTGAIHSPVILMRSGIGDEVELRKLDLHGSNKLFHNLPGVGKKLKDHLVIPRAFLTTSSQVDCCQSLNGVQTIFSDSNKKNDAQYVLLDGCIIKHAGASMFSSVFRRDYQHTNKKNIITHIKQYTFHIIYTLILTILQWTVKYIKPLTHFMTYHTSTLLITILHPKSHGTVTLTSSNQIRIDPAYLTDEESDCDSVVQAWNQSTRIKDTVMNKCWEILPGKLYKLYFSLSTYWGRGSRKGSSSSNEEEVIAYAKQFMQPYFHYIGTCSMINTTNQSSNHEEEAVVDENYKVIGMQGLRICDASVFVDYISAPTALTCASLGCILSDILIKEEDKEGRSVHHE